jgi:hypothetical protein
MPEQELPDEFIKPIGSPSNSSLSSTSSDIILINAQYIHRNPRSASISSGSTNAQDDDSIQANYNNLNSRNILNARIDNNDNGVGDGDDDYEDEPRYQPIKLPTEPTLEELLVRNRKTEQLKCKLN